MKETLRPAQQIRWYVDQNVHCGTPMLKAIRQVVLRSGKYFWQLPRQRRRFVIASIILVHGENVAVYRDVMFRTGEDAPPNRYLFDTTKKTVEVIDAVPMERDT